MPNSSPASNRPSKAPDAAATNAPAEPLIRQLIATGKCKQAVELAKENHKRHPNAESEQLLLDAYLARIEQFQSKGAAENAQTLLNLVYERFPAHRNRLVGVTAQAAAATGKLEDLIAPLAKPDLSAGEREAIESALRKNLVDLPALAKSPALPPTHPLIIAATALLKAFEAVTTGPVTEEQIALPEVSRRSPLAGWKMLVRAVAAFYRNDDEATLRALDGMLPDAATRRIVPLVKSMIDRKPTGTGAAAGLYNLVVKNDKPLLDALASVERATEYMDLPALVKSIRSAISAAATARPEIVDALRQRLAARSTADDVPGEEVQRAIGLVRKDAAFWRAAGKSMRHARQADNGRRMLGKRFIHHAVSEKMFTPDSVEASLVYRRAAELVASVAHDERERTTRNLITKRTLSSAYKGQAPEILALAPKDELAAARNATNPDWLFRKSVEFHPQTDTFKLWMSWALRDKLADRQLQQVAELWQQKLPKDANGPLLLAKFAEERSAFKLATKHLADAEAIDAMNPEVRKARLRLTLSITWGHIKSQKPHLLEKDLAELEALPAMRQGDRPAFLAALRIIWHALRKDLPAAQQAFDALAQQVGPLLAGMLAESICRSVKLKRPAEWPTTDLPDSPDRHAAADAEARGLVLGLDLAFNIWRPKAWDPLVRKVLLERPCPLSQTHLLALGKLAGLGEYREQGYLVSSAGLVAATGVTAARFLLIRAQALPTWARRRRIQCLRAALEIARQANDTQVISDVFSEVDNTPWYRQAVVGSPPLGDELLGEVLKREREAEAFPSSESEAERFVVTVENDEDDDDEDDGPGLPFFGDDDDDDDDDYSDAGGGFAGLPTGLPAKAMPLIAKLIAKYGRMPSPQEIMETDPVMALQLMAAMEGIDLDPDTLNDAKDAFPEIPWGRSEKKNKKKKKRR